MKKNGGEGASFNLTVWLLVTALVLVVVVKLHPGPALTSAVVMGVGGLFCVLSVMQNLYHWRVEKTRADEGLPAYGGRHQRPTFPQSPCRAPHPPPHPAAAERGELESSEKNELSTLV